MLSKQLNAIKNQRKAFLRNKNNRIRFLNDDMDLEMVLNNIKMKHSYFKLKSLYFDRHVLSCNEELKFNRKMKKFIINLILHMERDDILYILEYLVRIYNVDTFNTTEFIFILLPYEKYINQIKKLTYRTDVEITHYTYENIAKYFIFNYQHMNMFVKYYDYYDKLSLFLNPISFKIAMFLQYSKTNYMSEFMEIFIKLKKIRQIELIKNLYIKMKDYFNSTEFKIEVEQLINKSI